MTSREFLNATQAVLVEEFVRPIGSGVPARSLMDALKLASPWAEGWKDSEEEEALTASGNAQQDGKREPTEEEIVAQNTRALAWLERRMANVKGGFATV